MNRAFVIAMSISTLTVSAAQAGLYNFQSDWSDTANPNGPWKLREGFNVLPHVTSWQNTTGGWTTPQSGWADSEDGTNRLPFFFESNGTETFTHDFDAGDTVVHTTDGINGVGNGPANILFTVPDDGTLDITGGLWIGRDIGRSLNWVLLLNGATLTTGSLASGDPYSRANEFAFTSGSTGPDTITDVPVHLGDQLVLQFTTTSTAGDFVGIDLTVTTTPIPAPPAAMALLGAALLIPGRRWR